MTDDTIIDKVLKLLAKAESTTPEEVESLTAKATEMLQKHAIDEAKLDAARRARGERVEDKIVTKYMPVRGSYFQAHEQLAYQIGDAFGMKNIRSGRGNRITVIWVGFKSDVDLAEILYGSLLIQMQRGMTAWAKQQSAIDSYYRHDKMYAFHGRRSFCMGFAITVGKRLKEQRQAAVSLDEQSTSTALALVDRKQLVEDRVAQEWDLTASKSRELKITGQGFRSGAQAGARADIGGNAVGGTREALGR